MKPQRWILAVRSSLYNEGKVSWISQARKPRRVLNLLPALPAMPLTPSVRGRSLSSRRLHEGLHQPLLLRIVEHQLRVPLNSNNPGIL